MNNNNGNGGGGQGKWGNFYKTSTHNDRNGRNKNRPNERDVSKQIQDFTNDLESHSFVFTHVETDLKDKVSDKGEAKKEDDAVVDSGASSHSLNDESKFIEFDEDFKPQTHTVELADGTVISSIAEKQGTARINIKNENGELCTAILENALYIPSFPENIFSVRAACNKNGKPNGAYVVLDGEGGTLCSSDGTRFPIGVKGKLYYISCTEILC